VLVHQGRLLVVNAFPAAQSDLWCAPGGGVERGQSLHDNLHREIWEECGLRIAIGAPCLVNEFHDPGSRFHQVDIYFRAVVTDGQIDPAWQDPTGVVSKWAWVTEPELRGLRYKPDTLPEVAFGDAAWSSGALYDPLELLVR
jgi:8-oxo-dGTP pyrophosphatase MutT (NUDIX family)